MAYQHFGKLFHAYRKKYEEKTDRELSMHNLALRGTSFHALSVQGFLKLEGGVISFLRP